MGTRYAHVMSNEDRAPNIAGTTMKVVELVVGQQACRWSPEEFHFQHPYSTPGQIHSALAYCWDYREELVGNIQRRRIHRVAHPSPLVARLKLKDRGNAATILHGPQRDHR